MSENAATAELTAAARFGAGLLTLIEWIAIAACLPTALAFAARSYWMLELCTHFRVYYAAVLLPAALVLFFASRYLTALLAAACLAWNLYCIVPLYLPPATASGDVGGAASRALLLNVLRSNQDHHAVLRYIEAEDPDLIVLLEVDQRWIAALRPLAARYPHKLELPRDDNFGIALYSRLPAEEITAHDAGGSSRPSVVAQLNVGEQMVTLIAAHPYPPTSGTLAARRNRQLAAIGKMVGQIPGPKLVMGDLNTTGWSPYFQDLLAAGLVDSRRGFGIQPSWQGPRGLIRLPIDHVLTSPQVIVRDRRLGPPVGSDHLPVVVDFALARQ